MGQQWQLSSQLRVRCEDFGGSCLDLETRQWHLLNPSGWRLLQAATRGVPVRDDDIARLPPHSSRGGEPQALQARLDTFCQQLSHAGLLQRAGGTAPQVSVPAEPAVLPANRLRSPLLVSWNVAGPRSVGGTPARMSIWQAKALLRQIAKLDTFAIVLTGHDTVTLPGLTMLIRLGKDLGLHMVLNADGCVIGPDRARMLGASGLDIVTMNLDRAVSATHPDEQIRIRAGARFERAVAYLVRAGVRVDWHASLGDGVPPTESGVRDLLHLAELHSVSRVHFARPVPPVAANNMPTVASQAGVYVGQLRQAGHRLIGRVPHHYASPASQQHSVCLPGLAMVHIGPGGAVYPCPELTTAAHRWGDVIDQPLDALWDNHTPTTPSPHQPPQDETSLIERHSQVSAGAHDSKPAAGEIAGNVDVDGGEHPRLLPGPLGCPGLDFF